MRSPRRREIQNTFCPFEERYYDSPQALAEHYKEDFAFTPSSLPLEKIDPEVLHSLTEQVKTPTPPGFFLLFFFFFRQPPIFSIKKSL